MAWGIAIALGITLAAVEVVPLGYYLSRSPVWGDRAAEKMPAWELARPRGLDAICTAWPYAFGSQRRGHPNLARALGVHNLNESAGGFAGLATLIWLAPLGWAARRNPRAGFLAALVIVGGMGAFRVAPVDNLLRALPVLEVTDNRRLTLWVAFGLVLLGGMGLDHLGDSARGRVGGRWWVGAWVVLATGLLLAAGAVSLAGPHLRARALDHYARAAAETPGADLALYRTRAERQVQHALRFLPSYYTGSAVQLFILVTLATMLRRGWLHPTAARTGVMGLVGLDLLAFGFGLNPAISQEDDRPESAVIAYLRREVPPPGRVVGVGEELPPNILMRYGLADVRNYDSIELTRGLDWLAPLYETEPGRSARTSRRSITWNGVIRARSRLIAAGVRAVVGATPPPSGAFTRVDRVGSVWIARLGEERAGTSGLTYDHGIISCALTTDSDHRVVIAETYDPGWRAEVDGRAVAVERDRGTFLAVRVPAGSRRLILHYDPPEVRWALAGSLAAAVVVVGLGLTPRARKIDSGAWKPWKYRGKIESMTSAGPPSRSFPT